MTGTGLEVQVPQLPGGPPRRPQGHGWLSTQVKTPWGFSSHRSVQEACSPNQLLELERELPSIEDPVIVVSTVDTGVKTPSTPLTHGELRPQGLFSDPLIELETRQPSTEASVHVGRHGATGVKNTIGHMDSNSICHWEHWRHCGVRWHSPDNSQYNTWHVYWAT
jgi:hypothetical protein